MFQIGKGQAPSTDTYINEVAAWKAKANAASQALDSVQKVVEQIKTANKKLDVTNTQLTAQTTQLKTSVTKARKALDRVRDSIKVAGVDTLCDKVWELSEGYRGEADSLKVVVKLTEQIVDNKSVQIANLNLGITIVSERADSLQRLLSEAPKPPKPKKILWVIPQPSRTTAFLTGAVAGAIGIIAVSK